MALSHSRPRLHPGPGSCLLQRFARSTLLCRAAASAYGSSCRSRFHSCLALQRPAARRQTESCEPTRLPAPQSLLPQFRTAYPEVSFATPNELLSRRPQSTTSPLCPPQALSTSVGSLNSFAPFPTCDADSLQRTRICKS